jgi:hypothetical protein
MQPGPLNLGAVNSTGTNTVIRTPNPQLLEHWDDLFGCGGARFAYAANVNADGASLLPNLLLGVGQVIDVVTK